MVCNNL